MDEIVTVAARFKPAATSGVESVRPYGSGNINDTYLVCVGGREPNRFILQRINQNVFPYPELIMANLRAVTEHVAAREMPDPSRRWELPTIVVTAEGEDYLVDAQGEFWRALSFIEGARTYPKVNSPQHAGEAGYALGRFQRSISDLDIRKLHDTLPGFHIMPHYLRLYDRALEMGPRASSDRSGPHAAEVR
ncbi:MAG: phosphotransferase, partial [Anaerolineae bacterium]